MFSSLQPTKKYFLIAFLISCILLEVFTLVIYNQSKINRNSNEWVIHSYEVMRIGRAALINSIDLANAEQNYMLTGYGNVLKNYQDTLAELNANSDNLAKAVADNPEQQRKTALLQSKIDELKQITAAHIDALQKGRSNAYAIRASEASTKKAVIEIRAAFDDFSKNEEELLDQRTRSASGGEKSYLWTLFMGAILGLGALIVANLIIFSLISKNTRSEERLRKSEELFATIINGINDGVFDYNLVENTVSYSPTYTVIWGYSQEELSRNHDNFYNFVHPDDLNQAQETMRRYLEGETPTYYNIFRVRHRDGHWVWVLSRGVGIWDENGKIQRLIGTHVDISAQKQREEELNYFIQENERQRHELGLEKERAEAANQAKSDFLATMSHEIRTPLNAVIGLGRLLLDMPMEKKQHEMVEMLHSNADMLLQLVTDLLDLSRIESGQVELEERSFTFKTIFNAVHTMMHGQAKAKKLDLILNNHIEDVAYIGDPTRIQQILINLIGNAIKFTATGSISVLATAKSKAHTTEIKIEVTDTGVGIAQEKLETIFEKFVQADQTISRRFGGTGLGLAICKSLAQLMEGDISVASSPGEGSIFTLVFPVKISEQKKIAMSHAPALAAAASTAGNILVVEDYAPNVMVATMMLEHLGYQADIARNGTEALKKIREAQVPYTAILMDVQMQDMDGFETTRRLRVLEKEKGMRHFIIGVTAHALAGDREHCIEAGMDDYMSKPIHPDLLAQKLGALPKAA